MHEVSIVGVDLAKQVFQVHGAAADGRVLFRKKLSRPQFVQFMAALARAVNADEEVELALCGLNLGDVDVEEADRVALELLALRLVAADVRQARDAMPLQAAVKR